MSTMASQITGNTALYSTALSNYKSNIKPPYFRVIHRGFPADTVRNNDVVITSKRCHFDVITPKWHHFDIITTSLLRHAFSGLSLWILTTKGIQCRKYFLVITSSWWGVNEFPSFHHQYSVMAWQSQFLVTEVIQAISSTLFLVEIRVKMTKGSFNNYIS